MSMVSQFGSRLRDLRVRTGLTQKEFGEKFSISESAVGMYERNQREPSMELLSGFADHFGVSADYLLGRTSEAGSGITANRPGGSGGSQPKPGALQGSGTVREQGAAYRTNDSLRQMLADDGYTEDELKIALSAARAAVEAYRSVVGKRKIDGTAPASN